MVKKSIETTETFDLWEDRPDVGRRFLKERKQCEQLCAEVAYILEKRLGEAGIEFSAVTQRAKTLESFTEKIIRKECKDPFSEITDTAGVRVVYLYISDFLKIERIINAEFKVIKKVDKMKEQGTERFGYGAVHFLVKIGKKSSGARYEDLKDMVCEIQVRTILQDAWAIIDQNLVYKQEANIPTDLRRKLNSLAGVIENADGQFDWIRAEREAYLIEVENKRNKGTEFLDQDVDLDTAMSFLRWRFPNRDAEHHEGQLATILARMDRSKYSKLEDIENMLSRTEKALKAVDKDRKRITSGTGCIAMSLLLTDERFVKASPGGEQISKQFGLDKYRNLIK